MQRLLAEERQREGQLRRRAARSGNANTQAQVVTGAAGPAIVGATTSADADLVVIGSGGMEKWDERTVREDAFAALAEPATTTRCAA